MVVNIKLSSAVMWLAAGGDSQAMAQTKDLLLPCPH